MGTSSDCSPVNRDAAFCLHGQLSSSVAVHIPRRSSYRRQASEGSSERLENPFGETTTMRPIGGFIEHHYRHFNAETLRDAARANVAPTDSGKKMMITLAYLDHLERAFASPPPNSSVALRMSKRII